MKKRKTEDEIIKMLKNGTFPQVLILWGERGAGKLTCIKRALESHKNENNSLTHVEVLEPREHKNKKDKLIWIEDIIDLRARLLRTGSAGYDRFIILNEAENLRHEAQNALLKVFEEPGQRTHFVLLASSPAHLLETVRSRSVELKMNTLSYEDWSSAMQNFVDGISNKDLELFYKSHPGFVHRIVHEGHDILEEQIDNAYRLIFGDYPDRMGVANNLAKSDWPDIRLFTDIVASLVNSARSIDPARRKQALESILATSRLIAQYSNKGLALQHLALIKI